MSSINRDSNENELQQWKRAEMALKKFDQASKVHLEFLNSHRRAISKLRLNENSSDLWREKCNADRTIRQLVTDVNQITAVAANLRNDNHMTRFQEIIMPIKSTIENDIAEFLEECSKCANFVYSPPGSGADHSENNEGVFSASSHDEQQLIVSNGSLIDAIEELEQNAEAHKKLMQDIVELNECMNEIANMVSSQHETVDRVETHVENALHNVSRGERILSKVAKNKVVLGGAFIGAMLGGPAGFVIGAKAALLAALCGSALGAYSSTLISKKVHGQNQSISDRSTLEPSASYPKID